MAEERGVTKRFAKVCPCEACKKTRGARHKIEPKEVHSYSSSPMDGWRPMMTLAEKRAHRNGAPKPFFMGVELETDAPRARHPRLPGFPQGPREPVWTGTYETPEWYAYREAEREWRIAYREVQVERHRLLDEWYQRRDARNAPTVTPEEIVSMARPRGFWHAKSDSSVTGPEFASLPASLDWWYSRRSQFEFMFTTMLHAGVRSHVGDHCGMHINISMTAFADAAHLSRFAQLVNGNKTWAKSMSQRTHESMHWGKVGEHPFDYAYTIDSWARRMMTAGYTDTDRYSALNGSCGGGRLEFRLPRGTLRIDRFYKNLEWTHSMIEYTRQFGDVNAATYMRWVMGLDRYTDLQNFLVERFGLVNTGPYTPEAAPVSTGQMAVEAGPDVLNEWREPNSYRLASRSRAEEVTSDPFDEDDFEPDWVDGVLNRLESRVDAPACPCGDGCSILDCPSCHDARIEWGYDALRRVWYDTSGRSATTVAESELA